MKIRLLSLLVVLALLTGCVAMPPDLKITVVQPSAAPAVVEPALPDLPDLGVRGTIERAGVIDANGDGIYTWNGGTIGTYSDAGDTLTWSVSGATGDLTAGDTIVFEGSSADTYETTFAVTNATADRTITFPNSTGTVTLNPVGESMEFEGVTTDEYDTTLAVADPTTVDKTITLPDADGTVMLSTLATNAPAAANAVTGASNALIFEGSAADANETTISATNATAARSVVLPDAGGTVMLSSLATNGADAANAVTGASNGLLFEGATADAYETTVSLTDATADRTITLPDATGTVALTSESGHFFPLTADAVAQVGDLVMPDAGTAGRFDVHTGSATMPLGVLAGTGPSVQGTTGYPIVFGGLGRCAIQEDAAVTFAHWLIVSSTAGKCNDSATITTIGLNVGKALESAVVTNVINNTGCTGGAGCINTALDTPNAGAAGMITLSADVAAQGWAVGDAVEYWNSGGTTPTGLTDGKVYFLTSVSTTNVTLSATKGGATVVPSSQGDDPTQYLIKLPLAVISLN